MQTEEELVEAHPEGEDQKAGKGTLETATSLDTFAGKIHVKWAPEAAVSSLGQMPFFIEFLVCDSFLTRLFSTTANCAKIAARPARPLPGRSQIVQSGAAGGPAQDHWSVRQMGRSLSAALQQRERAGEEGHPGNAVAIGAEWSLALRPHQRNPRRWHQSGDAGNDAGGK